jgi:hypothetical protein
MEVSNLRQKNMVASKIALARASSIYKRQTRPLVREGAPQEQDRNCHTSNKDLVVSPQMDALFQDRLAGCPSVVT